jgi:ABC-type phosphate/phosphonate transport system ATPase subunit
MEEKIELLDLAEKDVVVVIGASRSGKGTLLTALKGKRIMFKPINELFNDVGIEGKYNDGTIEVAQNDDIL